MPGTEEKITIWHDDSQLPEIEGQHIDWINNVVSSLAIGGYHCVPRSGLVYTKVGERALRLTQVAPTVPDPREPAYTDDAAREQAARYIVLDFHYFFYTCEAAGIELDESFALSVPALQILIHPTGTKSDSFGTGKSH